MADPQTPNHPKTSPVAGRAERCWFGRVLASGGADVAVCLQVGEWNQEEVIMTRDEYTNVTDLEREQYENAVGAWTLERLGWESDWQFNRDMDQLLGTTNCPNGCFVERHGTCGHGYRSLGLRLGIR